MRSTGIWMLVLGVGAFVLPYFGLQFKVMSVFGDAQPAVAGAVAVIGAIVLALSFRTGAQKAESK